MAGDCLWGDDVSWKSKVSPERELIGETEMNIIEGLEKKHKMRFGGFSGGPMPREKFDVNFSIRKDFKNEGEIIELLLDCALAYLDKINHDEKMKTTVFRYPFPMNKVNIALFISNSKWRKIVDPKIRLAEWKDGMIVFTTFKKEKPFERHTITKLTLEEVMPTLSEDLQKRLKEATIY